MIPTFSSLIPNTLNSKLQTKLLNYYIEKLQNNPQLHDKIEFEILFTCYDLTTNDRLRDLEKFSFSKKEIDAIKNSLMELSNQIIINFEKINDVINNSYFVLQRNSKNFSQNKTDNYLFHLNAAENLLKSCRQYGTSQFSTMARIAFISSILLKA